ncbi:MAG: hypothetical protein JWL58_3318 [Streptosporangiaceae bacterium]|jgi:hypothetical protein|nr:hypothetical protein [Streptosporangiaceae bacterium]
MTVDPTVEPRRTGPLPAPNVILTAVVTRAHANVRRSLNATAQPQPQDDPWRQTRLLDFAIATLSGHIAAMRTTVHPLAGQALPHGRAQVTAYHQVQRDLEHLMWSLHQVLHGDARAPRRSAASLYRTLSTTFDTYAEHEAMLLTRLQQVTTHRQQQSLMRDIKAALTGAPTRPHPHIPRSLGRARPVTRIIALWDGLLDEVHGRSTPGGTGGTGHSLAA